MNAIHIDSARNDRTTLLPRNPSARRTAISRERSATAVNIVFSAPSTAQSPMTIATSPPSTVMSVETVRDCAA